MDLIRRWIVVAIAIAGMPTMAQQLPDEGGNATSAKIAASPPPTLLTSIAIYLHRSNNRWTASLEGDIKDPATEKIEVALASGSLRVLAPPLSGTSKVCFTKMKDRTQFGYLTCNSAFYAANKADAVAATVLRGVFSLGILTLSDAASGETGFTVSPDLKALEAAASEAGAIELARASAPLVEYRESFSRARSSEALRRFIETYEGVFDPEALVATAKAKLPGAIELEAIATRQKAEAAAHKAEVQRQREIQRQTEIVALRPFQAAIRPGDRVAAKSEHFGLIYGMVIEVKPPLAYLQWENGTAATQWIRLENLLPPR